MIKCHVLFPKNTFNQLSSIGKKNEVHVWSTAWEPQWNPLDPQWLSAMIGENRQLITDEPVEFEK